jgi:hypothetical protein
MTEFNSTKLFLDIDKLINRAKELNDTDAIKILTDTQKYLSNTSSENVRLKTIHNSPAYPDMVKYKKAYEATDEALGSTIDLISKYMSQLPENMFKAIANEITEISQKLKKELDL